MIGSIYLPSKEEQNSTTSFASASAQSISDYVHQLSPSFTAGRQEDSSLFLLSLLDHCKKCLLSPTMPSMTTPIDQIFGINVLSSIQCSRCSTISSREESQYLLTLEVDGLTTVTQALFHFIEPEIMEDDNAYQCLYCDDRVTATKHLSLAYLSPIVLINLKRTGYDGNARKLTHRINYDEWLDLRPYINEDVRDSNRENESDQDNPFVYRLYAVIVHIGEDLHCGHYTCYVRDSNNVWFLLDDALHRRVQMNEVLNNHGAFVLFYGKVPATSGNSLQAFKQQAGSESLPYLNLSSPFTVAVPSTTVRYTALQLRQKIIVSRLP